MMQSQQFNRDIIAGTPDDSNYGANECRTQMHAVNRSTRFD